MSGPTQRARWAIWAILAGLPLLMAVPLALTAWSVWTGPAGGTERWQDVTGLLALLAVIGLFYTLIWRSRRR